MYFGVIINTCTVHCIFCTAYTDTLHNAQCPLNNFEEKKVWEVKVKKENVVEKVEPVEVKVKKEEEKMERKVEGRRRKWRGRRRKWRGRRRKWRGRRRKWRRRTNWRRCSGKG